MSRVALCVLLLTACSGGDDNDGSDWSVTDQTLTGVIGGQSWTFADGESDDFLSDPDELFVSMYNEAYDNCEFSTPDRPFLLVSVPTEPGTYDWVLSRNMTFVTEEGDNLIVLDGGIIVDDVTATEVSGGLYAYFDDDNEVDGNFTIEICPDS